MKPNYIFLDAARCGLEVIHKANELCKARNRSLYMEKEFTLLQRVAPYLYEVTDNSDFIDWFIKEGIGQSWGIMLFTDWNYEATYDHFRRFLRVKNEDGKFMLFRFYDPRVLKIFLPTCDTDQLKEFFGKLDGIFVEEENSQHGEIYSFVNKQLIRKELR